MENKLLSAVQDGRQGLIDQQAQYGVQQTLDQREGHVEDDEALDEAVCRRQDGLIHAEDGFQRHVVELHIGRIGDEVVGRYAEHSHGCSACNSTNDGGLAALVVLIDNACHSGENRTQHEVAQLTHACSGSALDNDVQQVLHKADDHTVHRAESKGTQQSRQVRKVHLDEGRNEHRNGKLNEHQDKGHRAEHGGNSKIVSRAFFHGNDPSRGKMPLAKIVPKALFVSCFLEREGQIEKHPAATKTLQQGA